MIVPLFLSPHTHILAIVLPGIHFLFHFICSEDFNLSFFECREINGICASVQ